MKSYLLTLFFVLSFTQVACADTILTGFVQENPGTQRFNFKEYESGKTYELDILLKGGSVCGQARGFEKALEESVGHEIRVSGEYQGLTRFRIDYTSIIFLN